MKIYRKPDFANSTGDAIPLFHDGKYHLFTLTPPKGTTVYPARLRTTWEHAVSDDLVSWKQLPTALYPSSDNDAPDASGIWTGAVIFGEGKYHAFYTGYSLNNEYQQTICHAESIDGVNFEKDENNPVIVPKTDIFEPLDWRDPYVFYNDEEQKYFLLLSARKRAGALNRRGCVVLYKSSNLKDWSYYGIIYEPNHTNCPECSEMWKKNGKWYLSYSRFSEEVNTIYRISSSPYGPWRTPEKDGIGGRRFYAAKSLENDEGRRFYFGWAHDRAEKSDYGDWYWGGSFCIPHEVKPDENGELDVFLPKEIEKAFSEPVSFSIISASGKNKIRDNSIICNALGTLNFGFIDVKENTFLFSCEVKPIDVKGYFSILIKTDSETSYCLELRFEKNMKRASLLSLPMAVDPFWQQSCQAIPKPTSPGPDGVRVAEKNLELSDGDEIEIKIIIDNDMVEVFIAKRIAFTYRIYRKQEFQLGYLVSDGTAEFNNIEIRK